MKKGNLVSEVLASDLFSTCELLGSQGVKGRDFKNLRTKDKRSLIVASRVIRFLLDNCNRANVAEIEKSMEIKKALNMSNLCLALEAAGWQVTSSWRARDNEGSASVIPSPFRIDAEMQINKDNILDILILAGGEGNKSTLLSFYENGCGYESVEVRLFAASTQSRKCFKFHFVTASEIKEIIKDPLNYIKNHKESL